MELKKRDKTFEDFILLKIKRQFSKEEAVAVLMEELKKVNFKNGELLSQLSEIGDLIKDGRKLSETLNRLRKAERNNKTLVNEREMWKNKYYELFLRINKTY